MTRRSGEPTSRSVYQRVLGADFGLLEPRLQAYFGPIPDGRVGVGRGIYRDPSRQRVDVRITAPLLGEIFRYTGDFSYEVRPARE